MTAAEQFLHYTRCRKALSQKQWLVMMFLATVRERAWSYQEIMDACGWSTSSRGSYSLWRAALMPLARENLITFTPGGSHRAATAQITPRGYRFLGFKATKVIKA